MSVCRYSTYKAANLTHIKSTLSILNSWYIAHQKYADCSQNWFWGERFSAGEPAALAVLLKTIRVLNHLNVYEGEAVKKMPQFNANVV